MSSFPFSGEKSYTRVFMRTLYFDCFAGASGNMILGALIAAGVDREALSVEISKLGIGDFELEITTVDRSGISATHVDVKVAHEHFHRRLSDVEQIISASSLPSEIKERSIVIFRRLAEAEAAVHGIDIQKVHFHEVGAMDAIVDIVGACVGFEMLGIERFICSTIHVGSGFVEMAHGKFPVPPPAVTELLRGVPIYSTEIEGELTTPTGAAIISTLCEGYGRIPALKSEVIGYGAGTRDYKKFPNVLRILVGKERSVSADEGQKTAVSTNNEAVFLLETNIDDLSPQVLGFVMERAFDVGALDCWFTPIQMKKNRPATMLSILCEAKDREAVAELIYRETTTLGIRIRQVERDCLERDILTVSTEFGQIDVKLGRHNGKIVNAMPEYDQARRIAIESGVPIRKVIESAISALHEPSLAAAK
jgi:pyridinium-3,5-bisthiocarboxylic acid mononucleotide nickel chelatase